MISILHFFSSNASELKKLYKGYAMVLRLFFNYVQNVNFSSIRIYAEAREIWQKRSKPVLWSRLHHN